MREGIMSSPVVASRMSITYESAAQMLRAAHERARSLGIAVSVQVLDDAGHSKAFGRMDGAPLVSIDMARKKAATAVGFGLPTGEAWRSFVTGDPILEQGVASIPDFTMLGGGSPIVVEGALVGAVGVSGGHYAQDEDCVRAALASLGFE